MINKNNIFLALMAVAIAGSVLLALIENQGGYSQFGVLLLFLGVIFGIFAYPKSYPVLFYKSATLFAYSLFIYIWYGTQLSATSPFGFLFLLIDAALSVGVAIVFTLIGLGTAYTLRELEKNGE